MNEPRPHLKAVGADARPAADPGAAGPRPQPEQRGSRRTLWWIAALLALALLALVIQTRRVGALSNEVTRLSTELVGTRAALVAYEGRLATVREIVGDLSKRLGQLDDLVRRDPLMPLATEPLPPLASDPTEPTEPPAPVEP